MLHSRLYSFIERMLAILSKIVMHLFKLTNRKNDGLFRTPSLSVTGRGAIPPSLSALRIREFAHECFRFTFEGCFAAALTFTPWGAWKERLIPVLLLNIESVSRKSTQTAAPANARKTVAKCIEKADNCFYRALPTGSIILISASCNVT